MVLQLILVFSPDLSVFRILNFCFIILFLYFYFVAYSLMILQHRLGKGYTAQFNHDEKNASSYIESF